MGGVCRTGPSLDYVGDVAMSEIQRDKFSLQEVKGFLGDCIIVKDSMKFVYVKGFHIFLLRWTDWFTSYMKETDMQTLYERHCLG